MRAHGISGFRGLELLPEVRGGNNLEIYLPKTTFESVPYPDRGDFVKAIGQAWCQNTYDTGDGWLFLPSVKLRDIRTGEQLASYNCALGW